MMGKLIKLNEYNSSDSKKLEAGKSISKDTIGQIIMFTGIRYERQIDAVKGNNSPDKKRKRG